MKRVGNLYERIIDINNLRLADKKAQRGKSKQFGVIVHNKNRKENILKLNESLVNKTYRTSKYSLLKIYEPKERIISRLSYYPNRIVHHAIMNIIEPILLGCFISQTYSCIRKRGIHKGLKDLNIAIREEGKEVYCLKLDIKKFYPSVDKEILKDLLKNKFKDNYLLDLLSEIINSHKIGLPLGNYLSQWFANFYLNKFDH